MRSLPVGVVVLGALGAAMSAHADVARGVVVDGARQPLAGVAVRVIGERFIVTTHTDRAGRFEVTALVPGTYRIEADRGIVREPDLVPEVVPPHHRLTIDRPYFLTDRGLWTHRTLVGPTYERTGHVETASTVQGIRFDRPGW